MVTLAAFKKRFQISLADPKDGPLVDFFKVMIPPVDTQSEVLL